MKSKKGSSLIEFLIILAILGIILTIVIQYVLQAAERSDLRKYLGVDGLPQYSLDDPVVREMAKPQVAGKLRSLKEACETANAKVVAAAAADPSGLEARVKTYLNSRKEASAACKLFEDATKYAEELKLK